LRERIGLTAGIRRLWWLATQPATVIVTKAKANRNSSTSHLLKIAQYNQRLGRNTFEITLRAKGKSVKYFLQTRLSNLSLKIGRSGFFLSPWGNENPTA
jgi:hypothetical protein